MIIKKFTGKNEEEAVESARKELGSGVVIMNVRLVKAGGLFGFLKAKETEVTVALEEEQDAAARSAPPDLSAVRKAAAKTIPQPENSAIEKKLDSLQSLLVNQLKTTSGSETAEQAQSQIAAASQPSGRDAADDSEEIRGDEENFSEQEKFIRMLYSTMLDNDVDEKYANQLLEEMEKNRKHNLPIDNILAGIYQKMVLKFGKSEEISPSQNGPKIVLFIGPTGVGKTTTIAKLASKYVVEEKKKVALFTTDTYRIAAAEQLRTYADILEVPFRVIYTAEEFTQACQKSFPGYDYIFVDTAGHSHKNEQQLSDMGQLIEAIPKDMSHQCFLVLSATTKYRDLLNIVKIYKELTDFQFIFTKLDETGTLGTLFNVKMEADCPIAYVTYGQNVPDDIKKFNPQGTVKQLLGGKG